MSTNDTEDRPRVGRRRVLGAGATTAVAALGVGVGATGTATAQSTFDGWLDDVDNYDGVVDRRGQSEVTVTVGAQGNGGAFAFGPAAVRVDPGTEVVWEWTGEGGQHNVVAEEGADFESELTDEAGFTFSQTFDTEGTIKYFCAPHRSLGMKGAVAVGDDVPMATTGGGATGGDGAAAEGSGRFLPVSDAEAVAYVLFVGLPGLLATSILAAEYWPSRAALRADVAEDGVARETAATPPEREIGHDEYDPVGTGSLLIAYFVILVLMWVFMYFVEFLGRGPTIIG